MDNKLPESENNSITKKLSLGFIILGIGFLSWAMIGIWAPHYFNEQAAKNDYALPTAFASDAKELNVVDTQSSEKGKNLYPIYPIEGENFGKLTIPVLGAILPIIQGTSEKELTKGAGHYLESVLPGENDNCVISGHRETFFSNLGGVKIGDKLIAETSAGIFTYEVTGIRIVDKDDRTVIVPTEAATLTLTTCYPFTYIGSAPNRYIVSSVLID